MALISRFPIGFQLRIYHDTVACWRVQSCSWNGSQQEIERIATLLLVRSRKSTGWLSVLITYYRGITATGKRR